MPWTTDDLVAAVRRDGWFPDADAMSAADLLAWGDAELRSAIARVWKTAREEYAVRTTDISVVSGTSRYRLPRRAMARTVRLVTWVDSAGSEQPTEEISLGDKWRYPTAVDGVYYYEGDELVMPAAPTASGPKWRVSYLDRPSRLVPVADCAPITGSSSTTVVLCSATPATVTTATQYVDIVRGESPYPQSYQDLRVASSVAGVSITLNAATPIVRADLIDGTISGERADYLCARDTTCYPPIPDELHGALSMSVCARGLEARGDPKAREARGVAEERLRAAVSLMNPRAMERSRPMLNRNSGLRRR